MLEAIEKEICRESNYLEGEDLETMYFGGGTPSVLEAGKIAHLLKTIRDQYKLLPDAEISLEANPDDLNPGYLRKLREAGINRLSIGIQSFHDADLDLMNRRHDSSRARDCLEQAIGEGFVNINIDLIYGIPEMNRESWKENLSIATSYSPVHIAAYHLGYEKGTVLDYRSRKGRIIPAEEEKSYEQYMILAEWMDRNGYQHYEISNFARPGYISRHNSAYWLGKKYLGIGPSAHSFNGQSRRWNISGNESYIKGIHGKKIVYKEESPDSKTRFHDYLITSLRTMWGTDMDHIRNEWGDSYYEHTERHASGFIKSGKIMEKGGRLTLTREGMFLADHILRELMM
jgi:oxygen-independent coproporphyrinogen-3 oxidase